MAIDLRGRSSVSFYDTFSAFPATGSTTTLYVDRGDMVVYIWNGSSYEQLGGGSNITTVANYSALLAIGASNVPNTFYWCSSAQGTSWLPGGLGGTYYNSGLYYSNGTTWEYMNSPYQATQIEVDAGIVADKFVTPSTFYNSSKWLTKQDTLVSSGNIKTINGSSVLGSGNLTISGGGASGINSFILPTSSNFPNGLVNSSILANNFSNIIQTANRITTYPYIPSQTITSTALIVRCAIGVAAALGRVLIYSNLNGEPNTRLYESANLDCSTAGDKTITTAFTFTAGTIYWLAFHSSNTQTMLGIASTNMIPVWSNSSTQHNHYYRTFAFGSSPSPLLPDTYNSGTITNISIKL